MQDGFYFDEREQGIKPIPNCAAADPSLYWNPDTQRCEIKGAKVKRYYRYHGKEREGLGFLPAVAPVAAASGPAAPIVLGIAGAVSAIAGVVGKLFGGAAQRGRDEATSGDYLTAADQSKNEILQAYQYGKITKQQAADLFESQVINGFKQKISTLKTESVVKSRTENQVRDLRNLFYNDLDTLPTFFSGGSDDSGDSGVDPFDLAGGLVDIFGNPLGGGNSGGGNQPAFNPPSNEAEIYGDDGSYYYENSATGEWFYDDGQGNSYGGSGQGDSYGIENGDYYEVDTSGNYYYEAGSGEWYYEDASGQWASGDPAGYGCNGDAAGNWSCSDGSRGGPDTLSIKDRQNRQRAPQKRSTPAAKKATGAQKAIQLAQQGAKVIQQARAQAQGSAVQARRLAAAQTINSAGARNPQVRAITGAAANANGGSGLSSSNLLLLGLAAVGVIVLSKR